MVTLANDREAAEYEKEDRIGGYADDLTNPDKGYVAIKGFLSDEQADRYRSECQDFLETGTVLHHRLNRPDMFDYVHPRTVLANGRITKAMDTMGEANITRIYQFLHNRHHPETKDIFRRALALRDRIEKAWLHDETYRTERDCLLDYVQVTEFAHNSRGLPKHQDADEALPYPLLQCLVLLSQPGEDYLDGDFVIYTKNGAPVGIQADLGLGKGDLVYFDKFLFHEVAPTKKSPRSDLGRWSVVIGGRDRIKGSYFDRYRYRSFYVKYVHPIERRLSRALKRVAG